MKERENFATRMGFLLVSAGCAIGLGNIWRFPWMAGNYGGGLFVLIYLVFLVILGLPVMTAEFTIGRGSKQSIARSFQVLQPKGTKWHIYSYFAMAGNYLLMMFYTTVSGWMLFYLFKMVKGEFRGMEPGMAPGQVGNVFLQMLGSPGANVGWMIAVCVIGFAICIIGLQSGVEKITKFMMSCLFIVLLILVIRSVTLPGAGAGLRFYLVPSLEPIREHGIWTIIYAAMGQAFFTLSLGMGSMLIFGSYLGKEKSLLGESRSVLILDTIAALGAGLIIFQACFAFGINPGQGAGLIFITIPNIFNNMPGGYLFGILFFLFMSFAALSTVVAVFENIVAFGMDLKGWSRKKAVAINAFAIVILALPCALGFNVLDGFFAPLLSWLGEGSAVIDFEDFLIAQNILPLGSAIFILFCMTKKGWGYANFMAEVNAGEGLKWPDKARFYITYILPAIIALAFILGYINKFTNLLNVSL
ncbi:MAG: sodium-dependent transporter [Treponema sp.]|nr:sodium-dependent transporter [Treponema sp.]